MKIEGLVDENKLDVEFCYIAAVATVLVLETCPLSHLLVYMDVSKGQNSKIHFVFKKNVIDFRFWTYYRSASFCF